MITGFAELTAGLPYDCELLQYLLIDGRICGASVGHFRYGPYDLNDIVCDLPKAEERREEILEAVLAANPGGEVKYTLRFKLPHPVASPSCLPSMIFA